MKRMSVLLRWLLPCAACLVFAVSAARSGAQETAAGSPEPTAAGIAPAAPENEEEEVIELSPFTVSASENEGYRATTTLAGTRIKTQLKDVGSSISVVTEEFLRDTNSRTAEDLLVYTTGTEVTGQGGNFLGAGDGAILSNTNRSAPVQNTRVRGLAEADNTRDFFLSDIPWDSYNVSRVDLQRGPNSVLFGIGSPAGIVNSTLNTAMFNDALKFELQFGSYGSVRGTFDVNKEIIPDELALRIALLDDEKKYRQDPAYRDDKRYYVAARWVPKFLSAEGAKTDIRVNFEHGYVRRNEPRYTPPLDAITPWFGVLQKNTMPFATSDSENSGTANYQWYGAPGNRVWDGVVTAWDEDGQGIIQPSQVQQWPIANGGTVGSGIGDNVLKGIRTYDGYANPTYPEGSIGAYKATSLTDPSIFNFYDNLLEGPNKMEFNDFDAMNIALSQTFFDNKIGIEAVYDRQDATWGYRNFISGDASVITVDIMETTAEGTANPNLGRPMTIAGGGAAGYYRQNRIRETQRVTAFGELDFADVMGQENLLTKILGRHMFTGLFTQQVDSSKSWNGPRFAIDAAYEGVKSSGGIPDALGQASRDDIIYYYLGGDISGRSNASGLNLPGIQQVVVPRSGNIRIWNNTPIEDGETTLPGQWVTVNMPVLNNDSATIEGASHKDFQINKEMVKSYAFIWQGYLFDGNLVPMFGYREDKDTFRSAGSPLLDLGVVVPDPNFRLPSSANDLVWTPPGTTATRSRIWNSESGISRTYSIVGHLPREFRERLPGNMGVSLFYNQSENFKPDAGRRDIFGNSVPSPNGDTKEWGAAFYFLDDKVTLKITRYKTKVNNAGVGNALRNVYLIGANEAWGQQAAYRFRASVAPGGPTGDWPASPTGGVAYGLSTDGHQVTWRPAGSWTYGPDGSLDHRVYNEDGDVVGYQGYTQAELDATYAMEQASIDAWYATQVPQNFQDAWALGNYSTTAGQTNYGFQGLTVTGDTASEGTEFEIVANPIRGLNIAINGSKSSASRNNLAGTYTAWIEQRWAELAGPAGDMRLWGTEDDWSADSAHGGETARGKFAREVMSEYNLYAALESSDVPELREWRVNLVANYSFPNEGFLKGSNVGMSYRWASKQTIGFPVIPDAEDPAGEALTFDVESPFYGPSESNIDLWVGYERMLTDKLKWRIQLNVRNAFGDDDLIPVTVNPDPSTPDPYDYTPAAFRIPEPTTWTLTNTISF